MKTKSLSKKSNFIQFLSSEIKRPEVIQGGSIVPIDRDKLRPPKRR